MVKASSSQRPSSCTPPFSSLSLASTPLKACKPSPFFFFLKHRSQLVPAQSMDPSSSPSSAEDCADDSSTGGNLSLSQVDRQHSSKSAEITFSLGEDVALMTEKQGSMCGRQRLQQHHLQVSGKVIIPDTWGREQQLQEWVSYGIVEDALRPAGLMSARSALVSECQHREEKPVRTAPPMSADVEVS